MIKETDNMATTNNRLLKQCKVKFANCYQLNGGVSNIPVFVDKFLNRLAFGHLSFDAWDHLSGQCMLFSIVFAGIGMRKGMRGRKDAGNPAFLYSKLLRNVSLFFLVSHGGYQGKRRILKTNLIDYLENHLSGRIPLRNRIMKDSTAGKPGGGDRNQRKGGKKAAYFRQTDGGTDADASRAVQPEETSDRLDREVFSTENATPEKAEGKAITERPEDPARVTEEELQALLQELLTV